MNIIWSFIILFVISPFIIIIEITLKNPREKIAFVVNKLLGISNFVRSLYLICMWLKLAPNEHDIGCLCFVITGENRCGNKSKIELNIHFFLHKTIIEHSQWDVLCKRSSYLVYVLIITLKHENWFWFEYEYNLHLFQIHFTHSIPLRYKWKWCEYYANTSTLCAIEYMSGGRSSAKSSLFSANARNLLRNRIKEHE